MRKYRILTTLAHKGNRFWNHPASISRMHLYQSLAKGSMKQLQRRTCGWMVGSIRRRRWRMSWSYLSDSFQWIFKAWQIYTMHMIETRASQLSVFAPHEASNQGHQSGCRANQRLGSVSWTAFWMESTSVSWVVIFWRWLHGPIIKMGPSLRSMVNCILANLPRRDRYERNINVYWVEGNLRGKKLSLGRKILRTCIHDQNLHDPSIH